MSHSTNKSAKGIAPIAIPIKRARNFRAGLIPFAWRLPKGIINASDNELESSGDACETLSWVCGGIVVLGVLAEAVLAGLHLPYDSLWERWDSVIANAAVVLGVVGEVQFGMMAFRRDKELKRRSDEKLTKAHLKIAELNNETTRLRVQDALTNDALLASVRAGRDNAIASVVNRSVTEAIAVKLGLVERETTSEPTKALYIVSKVEAFAGKQFDAVVASTDVEIGGLLLTLKSALNIAGWIEVNRDNPTAGIGWHSMDRTGGPAIVRIDVDASKDQSLLEAADVLASALNAEGIAAVVTPNESEATKANVIHIVVGPKAE